MTHQARQGALVDGSKPITFTFEGRSIIGLEGDTIASALAANGQWVLSRSFKYHRPRGSLTMAGQDGNTLVQIGNTVSVQADRFPISEGLSVEPQNVTGTLARDRDFILNRLSKFLPVGFYYRSFYWPKGIWERVWEPVFRAKAGLGRLNPKAKHSSYHDKAYHWYNVVVVGGGPAGLAAAVEASNQGAKVLLVDENPILGGALTYARFSEETNQALALIETAKASSNIDVMTAAQCNGVYADNWLAVIEGNRLHKIRAEAVVLATGMVEQPAQFRNNDLPGIMLGSAAQRLIKHYGVQPGRKAVILAGNDDAYGVALDLDDSGLDVTICDLRLTGHAGSLRTEAQRRNLQLFDGWCITEATPTHGHRHVRGVKLARLSGESAEPTALECDLVCMSVGYMPAYQLAVQAGGKVGYDAPTNTAVITGLSDRLGLAGSVDGRFELSLCLEHGRAIGGHVAAQLTGADSPVLPPRSSKSPNHLWPIETQKGGMDFVDFDEDLTVEDIQNAVADGYREIELVKRFSTVGMGPSQGRQSAFATARVVSHATGRTIGETGITNARPPASAENIATLAGRSFTPMRRTPMHALHEEAGATWLLAGNWHRPAHYGDDAKIEESIAQEVKTVRNNVGVIDVSTLGGLDVRGPDAAAFVNRMYTFAYAKLPVGKSRYLLMTDNAGTIIDDGVACRLAEDYFYLTTATTSVDRVYRSMLWWNAQWRMDVDISNVTAAYAAVNLAGPNARQAIEELVDDIDVSAEEFPYLAYREGHVLGIPARVFRVGFVGELGYEIHVPSRFGAALWRAIMDAGEAYGIRPFGLEAQRIMRLEKGHVIVGQDTDGMSTPEEVNMEWAVSKKKPYFVGKRSLELRSRKPSNRKLVGFSAPSSSDLELEDGNLVVRNGEIVGFVTSTCRSPTLGKTIGLAYVAREDSAEGAVITVRSGQGSEHRVEVCSPHFYDPDNVRQTA